jgi:dihydrofolate reductase
LLLGRVTYEGFSAAWPEREGEFADKFNSMEKYVVSSTLTDPSWNNTTVLGSVDDVARVRQGEGGPILLAGSATLVHGLYDAGLVDEWRLMVFPVILGSGKRLFPSDAEDKAKLQLVDSTTYANGVQLQILRAAG